MRPGSGRFPAAAGDEDAILVGATSQRVLAALEGDALPLPTVTVPQRGDPSLKLLRRIGVVDPTSWTATGPPVATKALLRVLEMGPGQVIAEIKAANLRGRGGAAFPMGIKWDAVARSAETPSYVICNADESEPGTFKDRVLMEGDPFALVESMTIAGLTVGAELGYLYIRAEYPVAQARMCQAIASARGAGLLGGGRFGFRPIVRHRGPARGWRIYLR